MYLYPGFREELLRLRRQEIERRTRFNAADELTRATRAAPSPGKLRTALARRLVRAAYALAGESATGALVALPDEDCIAC